MKRLSFYLPIQYRIDLQLVKSRKSADNPLLPDLVSIFNTKKGNKISRYFRHIFENKNIKKVIGTNLIFFSFASSMLPTTSAKINDSVQETVKSPVVINTQNGVQYPVDKIVITQGYKFYHPALDFDGVTGDTIKPIMAGVVEKVDYSRLAYGNSVLINHGGNITSLYAHLSSIIVTEGQEVTKEIEIGKMGATGRAFGDHLHFEVRENGKNINPFLLLPTLE